jgi:hypothetical protein
MDVTDVVRFLRERCPKLDVGGEAIGEFLRSGSTALRISDGVRWAACPPGPLCATRAVPDESAATRLRSIDPGWRIRRTNPKDWLPSNPRPHLVEGIGSRGRQRTGDGTRYLRRLEPDLATRIMN